MYLTATDTNGVHVMSKILVAVWEPLIALLNKKVKSACLKRDEFLDHVLRHEARMLAREISGRNSDEAKAYIAKHLRTLRPKQVNLNLSDETKQAIAEACDKVNVPRDAFINRVLLFLVAEKPFFKRLLVDIDWEWAEGKLIEDYYSYFEPILDGALPTIRDVVRSDPFQYYRACIELTNDAGGYAEALHDAFIPKDLLKGPKGPESAIGFNCHVPDAHIEGHPVHEEMLTDLESLLMEGSERKNKTAGRPK
jgi:hypothetical protein